MTSEPLAAALPATPECQHPNHPVGGFENYELVLEAGRIERTYWRDILRYRELFVTLAWRDLAVRYKQTAIGVAWALIRPFLTMLIFTVIFGRVAHLPSDGAAPYALLVAAGMLPWGLFSTALGDASNSLLSNSNLISKVYFPRVIVPVAAIVTAFVDFLLSLLMVFAIMAYYGFAPGWQIIFLPAYTALAVLISIGPGLYLAALNVKYRDFRYVIPFLLQFGLYASPVGFSSDVVPDRWRLLYSLNPVVGVIDGFRWALLGGQSSIYWPALLISTATAGIWLWLGVRRFRRMEKVMADII